MNKLPWLKRGKRTATTPPDAPPSTKIPLDRAAPIAIGLFSLGLVAVLLVGDRDQPQITAFSWADATIGVEEQGFTLEFDRPMDWATVTENLEITPPLAGELSWVGNRLAYTLTDLPEYGKAYTVTLTDAIAQAPSPRQAAKALPPFESTFKVRDRAFAYIGVTAEEQGRLMLFNLTTGQRTPLTAPDLIVTTFQPGAEGRLIYFLAFERDRDEGLNFQQLYRVSTGRAVQDEENILPGRTERLLAADRYENRQFTLASRTDTVIVERLNRQDPRDRGLWLVQPEREPRPLGIQSETFSLSPDGQVLALSQATGVSLIPLTPAAEAQQFFPNYESLLTFSHRDPSRKLLVRNNLNLTRSLILVNEQGFEQQLLQTAGFILDCEFEPRQENFIYCIQAETVDENQTEFRPFLTLINLETGDTVPLVALTNDLNVRMSLARDGRTLLFDQVTEEAGASLSPNRDNQLVIPEGSLWLLELPDLSRRRQRQSLEPPQNLTPGLDPQWLP